jgi:purine nucleosidase
VVATNSWKCTAALAQFYASTQTLLGIDTAGTGTETNAPHDFIGPCAGFASPSTPTPPPNSAVSVYRRALASQPDGSVVIAGIGYFENLDALLHSGPDGSSPLTGSQLVARKVRMLVQMAGCYPNPAIACAGAADPENNMVGNPAAAADVAANWPTKIVWSGYEVGHQVESGQLIWGTETSSPVRAAYTAFGTTPGNYYYSFDLTAVYHAIRPADPALTELGPGTNAVDPTTGSNTFTMGAGNQYYLSLTNASSLDASLNTLLAAAP